MQKNKNKMKKQNNMIYFNITIRIITKENKSIIVIKLRPQLQIQKIIFNNIYTFIFL